MTRSILTTALAGAIALPLLALPVQAGKLVQVVIDHSGVLHDEQDPQGKSGFNSFLNTFLSDLARQTRRDRNRTQIVLISAVEPPHILWSGTAGDFYRTGVRSPAVQGVITGTPNGCNNLPAALDEVMTNDQLEAPEESAVHVITSGVHSGPDCADLSQEDYIKLVETADAPVITRLQELTTDVDSVAVHFLTAPQRRAFLANINGPETDIKLNAQGQETGL